MVGPHKFPKDARLRKRREYLAVQRGGATFHGRYFLTVVLPGPQPRGRVGITVSKRVGNAVTRNRIKRWVREHVRHNRAAFVPAATDVVVIAKASAARVRDYAEVADDLGRLGSRMRQ